MLRASRRALSSAAHAKSPRDVVIVAANRTPIGSFQGALAALSGPELGAAAVKDALARTGLDGEAVDEAILGNVVGAGSGQAPARQVVIKSGLGWSVPATAINKVCASGMKSVMLGAQTIMAGQNDCVVAGGFESMSNVPYYLQTARSGLRLGHSQATDGVLRDGLWDVYDDIHMGSIAEMTAEKFDVSRETQDMYAVESYRRAAAAWEAGLFDEEVVPVTVKGRRGKETVVKVDEEYTRVNFDKVPQLRPAFKKDGTVTAANASSLNDGAASVIVTSRAFAEARGLAPLARVVSFADFAHENVDFPTAPAKCVPKALERAGLDMADVEYFETNEAFASILETQRQLLGIEHERHNVFGGAVAIGHPIGASGARIITTLLSVLKHKDATVGCASICNGGGGASAIVVARE